MMSEDQVAEVVRQHYQALRRQKNINKHLRIARATTGHESRVHMQQAARLLDRYETLIKESNAKENANAKEN